MLRLALAGVLSTTVLAHPAYRDLFPNGFNVPFNSAPGHVDRAEGGGAQSAFGKDFRLAGYKWTKELCMMDSDGDGQTNGLELGDPCCHWKVGDEPLRSFGLGDPSATYQISDTAGPMNCTKVNQATDPDFWAFYWKTTDAQSVVDGDIEAAKPICTFLLVCVVCAWMYLGMLEDVKSLGFVRLLVICVACFCWMDCLSGILHITLDNPNLNNYPLIGGACRDFQEHHHNPGFLTRKPWHVFLQEVHVPVAAFITWSLLRPHNRYLKVWYFLAIIGAHGMMAAHRLSHTAPARVPWIFQLAQENGFLITAEHHSKHHMSYDVNFSILAGLMDPVLNEVVKYVDRYSVAWFPITVGYGLFPIVLACLYDSTRYVSKLKKA